MPPWPQPARWHRVTSAARDVAAHRGWLAAIPVVLVNAVAFYGSSRSSALILQRRRGAGACRCGTGVDSRVPRVAGALAQLADDSALRLRLAAYGMASSSPP